MREDISIAEINGPATPQVFSQCASIHIAQITGGFLTTLGPKVLARVYRSIAASQHAFLIVAQQNEQVVGFVCGCFDTGKLYRDVICKNAFPFLIAGVRKALSLETLRKIWETLVYPNKEQPSGIPTEEILNFCVSPTIQRTGLGSTLMIALSRKFAENGVSAIRIVTGAEQKSAISFYEKIGADKVHEFEVHRGTTSYIYRYQIPEVS